MHVLNVAEKPSVAKEISAILSSGRSQRRAGLSKYNAVYEFRYSIQNQPCNMIFTSVSGHLMEIDFAREFRSWSSCDPTQLFDAPIVKSVRNDENAEKIAKTLMREARKCQWLVLWLDCDREGENIAFEVKQCCEKANRNLVVKRAKFSALIPRDIKNAVQQLVEPDIRLSRAVDARSEIDLRIGAGAERYAWILYINHSQGFKRRVFKINTKAFQVLSSAMGREILSQFPTLGFIVDRYQRIKKFVREAFWTIAVVHSQENSACSSGKATVNFSWKRGRIFDKITCVSFLDIVLEHPVATVVKQVSREITRKKPVPLATVELQKRASRWLRISSERTMKLAEALYNRGIISYPRTETDRFKEGTDLVGLLTIQGSHHIWGEYATRLVRGQGYGPPIPGRNDDQAHPPIHPTKCVSKNDFQSEEEWKVYELVTRHFLACLSDHAKGTQTSVDIEIGGETFSSSGQMVLARNFLEIYKWEKWNAQIIPRYEEGTQFEPDSITLQESRTNPPPLLSESDLISEMDKNGIGTDATIAEHINTIQKRAYAMKNPQSQFEPTPLGLALVESYDAMGYALSKPYLRSAMERDCKAISLGQKSMEDVVKECLTEMGSIFRNVKQQVNVMDVTVSKYFERSFAASFEETVEITDLSQCGICRSLMSLKRRQEGVQRRYLCCAACQNMLSCPSKGKLAAKEFSCPICQFQIIQVSSGNGYSGKGYTFCPKCYSEPPAVEESAMLNMPCFKCTYECPMAGGIVEKDVMRCPACRSQRCVLKKTRNGKWVVSCKGYPSCSHSIWLSSVKEAQVLERKCHSSTCVPGAHLVRVVFIPGSRPASIPSTLEGCVLCHPDIAEQSPYSATLIPTTPSSTSGILPTTRRNPLPRENAPSTQSNQRSSPATVTVTPPTCTQHATPCIVRKTRKAGENHGREFYCCSFPHGEACNFFEWVDTVGNSQFARQNVGRETSRPGARAVALNGSSSWNNQSLSRGSGPKRNRTALNAGSLQVSAEPSCHCSELAVQRVVVKNSENKGRAFFTCGTNSKCGFFQWKDGD